ncbi:hypothetical protein [Micromonospora sp. DPT]|uniref:Cap15 family cyclic dinucleotide receptor domain-containing protein n=1 Tax=Micromonospora sp. DPT TaxID=3142975 RepID=UPI00320B1853
MKRTITIRVIASVVVVVFVAGAWLTNGQLDLGWMRFFSVAVLVATLVLGLWDIWLWRLSLIQRIPRVPRCIRGTWQGTLTSFWVNPATGKSPPPKTVYLVVHQTATLVSVKLLTDESRSTSALAKVSAVDGASVLTYLYLNRPDMRVEHRSRMHHGSTVLDISGRPAGRMKGRYWTDRDSKGELELTQRYNELADDFAEACGYFEERTQA